MQPVTSKVPITYDILIEVDDANQFRVDWGKTPDWIKIHKEHLDNARRISLLPKPGQVGPMVSVFLDGDKRWVIGSRVHGSATAGTGVEFRIYFIGWQRTVGNENVKSVHWVYPGGMVECSPEPTMVAQFMEHFKKQAGQQG